MDEPQKFCAVCGMPLITVEDYPDGADMNIVDGCQYCGSKDGIKSYGELIMGMAEFIKGSERLSEEEAKSKAEEAIKGSKAYKEGRIPA